MENAGKEISAQGHRGKKIRERNMWHKIMGVENAGKMMNV